MSKEVYVVAGGPSLEGFDFSKLRGKDTIAVNMAALDVPDPTFCITADSRILRKLQEGFFNKVSSCWVVVTNPNHASMKWEGGRFVHKDSGFVYNLLIPNMIIRNTGTEGIGFRWNDFRTGYNSGFCGFQLAVLLGYDRIYLLGFDMVSKKDRGHYHKRYGDRRIPDRKLDQFYHNFVRAIKSIRENTDIEVISCSDVSRLNDLIPYVPFENTLSDMDSTPMESVPTIPIKLPDPAKMDPNIRLSILICHLESRREELDRLLSILHPQKTDAVEILIESDNGKLSVGTKRNLLLRRSRGAYIAFVDDDDMLDKSYVERLLEALSSNPDCVGIEGLMKRRKTGKVSKFVHSKVHKSWFQRHGVYYRCPNHLNPVRRELALTVGFPDRNHREDSDYSLRLLPLLKSEVMVRGPLYYYLAD